MNFFNKLSPEQKGAVFIGIGLILLSYILGIFSNALYNLILISSIFLIIYGIVIGNYWTKFLNIIKKLKS